MENLQVSILVPIYGVEKYIRRCAISLMEQTYDNIEYVFVNDCTKDKSVAILKEVISDYPEREENVKIINLPKNQGLANARNVAIENSNGDFVIIVDSDDWVELDMVECLVKEQRKENADIVSSNTFCHRDKVVIGDTFKSLQPDPLINIIERKAAFNIWGRLIKKSLYTDNDIKCRIGVNQGEDLQTFPKLAYFAKKHVCVNKALYHYNGENENAYTYVNKLYKISDIEQQYESFSIFYDFFMEKDADRFSHMLAVRKMNFLFYLMKLCAVSAHMDLFKKYLGELRLIEKQYPDLKFHDLVHLMRRNYHLTRLICNYVKKSL